MEWWNEWILDDSSEPACRQTGSELKRIVLGHSWAMFLDTGCRIPDMEALRHPASIGAKLQNYKITFFNIPLYPYTNIPLFLYTIYVVTRLNTYLLFNL